MILCSIHFKPIGYSYTYNAYLYDLEGNLLAKKQVDLTQISSSGLLPEFYSIACSYYLNEVSCNFVVGFGKW